MCLHMFEISVLRMFQTYEVLNIIQIMWLKGFSLPDMGLFACQDVHERLVALTRLVDLPCSARKWFMTYNLCEEGYSTNTM